jgi:hypothetical protein
MIVYIFEHVSQLTEHWHCYGGLVVIAENDAHARELIAIDAPKARLTEEEWSQVVRLELAADTEPQVFVFPDAGCC